jgi:prevent-host-death family protein
MLEATIRELEAHLSDYVRKAAEGEDVRVSVDGRVVARLVAFPSSADLAALKSERGVTWSGGKPAGLKNPEVVPAGVSLADWVVEDRR